MKYVNEYRAAIDGYEQGRTKHGFRFVYPIYNRRGEYLGAVDFTFSSDYLQDVLANYLNIHSHFLVDKDIFKYKAWKDGDVSYKYKKSIESDRYLIALNHNKKDGEHIIIKFDKKTKEKIEKSMTKGIDFSIYTIDNKNATIISFLAIKNVKDNKTIAYLVAYTKNRTIYDIVNRYQIYLL